VELQINNVLLDQIILISPELVTPLLLGMDFCVDNHVIDYKHEDSEVTSDSINHLNRQSMRHH
jgi:hypothetical protein